MRRRQASGLASGLAPGAPVGDFTPGSGAFTALSSTVSYLATGTYGSQVTIGLTAQGGRIDLRRGSDGTNQAWLGWNTATTATDLTLENLVSTGVIRLRIAGITPVFATSAAGGSVGVAVNPAARLHLPAGAAAPLSGPLKLTAGTNLTVVENGTLEFDGGALYFTHTGVRRTITMV